MWCVLSSVQIKCSVHCFDESHVIHWSCTGWLKKCPSGQNAISRQSIEFFSPKFEHLQWKEFSTVLEYFTKLLSLLYKYYSFWNILFWISKITLKKWTVTCNIRCSTSLNSLSQSTSKCPSHLLHKLSIAVFIKSCGSWSHINCKTFFSPSVFFSYGWNVL